MRRINAVLIKLSFLPVWAWGIESAQNQNLIFFRTCGFFPVLSLPSPVSFATSFLSSAGDTCTPEQDISSQVCENCM